MKKTGLWIRKHYPDLAPPEGYDSARFGRAIGQILRNSRQGEELIEHEYRQLGKPRKA